MKLVNMTEFEGEKCKLCQRIEKKYRRRSAELERLSRLQREGPDIFRSTKSFSTSLIKQLEGEITQLSGERERQRRTDSGIFPDTHTGIDSPSPPLKQEKAGLHDEQRGPHSMACSDSGYASAIHPGEVQFTTNRAEEDDEEDDKRTEYSATSTIGVMNNEAFISECADSLFTVIASFRPSNTVIEELIDRLPDILKAFALKIGYKAPSQMHRDIMFFVHKYRWCVICVSSCPWTLHYRELLLIRIDSAIVASFKRKYFDEDRVTATEAFDSAKIPIQELIYKWLDAIDSNMEDLPATVNVGEWDDDYEEFNPIDSRVYGNLIRSSLAYKWLLRKVDVELRFSPPGNDTLNEIRHRIWSSLQTGHRISRKCSSMAQAVIYEIEWAPLSFIMEQQYKDTSEIMDKIITITGSANCAQALTCTQYLRQTWPSSGDATIRLVKEVICKGVSHTCTRMFYSCFSGT